MMKTLYSLAGVTLLMTIAAAAPGTIKSRSPIEDVTYYSCADKTNGNYLHPWDCTRFIMCHNGRAADMPCADCDMNNVNGCQGNPYLVYNLTVNLCDWPRDTECMIEPTQVPTEDPITEGTTEEATSPPEQECSDIQDGQACDIGCDQCDWCHNLTSFYVHCVKNVPSNPFEPVTGAYKREKCDQGYLIDKRKPLADGVIGGQCTAWGDLHPETQAEYKENKACVPDREICEWGQDARDHCTGHYWYRERPGQPKEERQCPGTGIWDTTTNNCRDCGEVETCRETCGSEEVTETTRIAIDV